LASLVLQVQRVGIDCIECSLQGEASGDAVPRLEAVLAEALAERRHVMLNFGACDYIASDVVSAITAGRELLAESGLDLTQFGASGVVRPILRIAFARRHEEASLSPGRVFGARRLGPRPAQ
jgi:anti-anti-sigma regulatory factor